MKVFVHKRITTERIPTIVASKYHKSMLPVYAMMMLFVAVELWMICSNGIIGLLASPFALLWTGIVVWLLFIRSPFPDTFGTLYLEERITFYCTMPRYLDYAEIAVLHIGNCPPEFTMSKPHSRGAPRRYYKPEEWAAIYGDRYIIAENADGHPLFACTYNEEVYRLLVQRGSETASCLFDEAAYAVIAAEKCRRREIEQQTFAENGGQEILDGYRGYIN